MSLRVVAGLARGRRLAAPASPDVRPTTDRVREAVFNSLGSLGAVEGARVLDLFGGSGALAIEALSRGAASAVVVERSAPARRVIVANLTTVGFADRAEVIAGDAETYLERQLRQEERFDLAFLDPPYDFDRWPDLLARLGAVLAPEAVVVIESNGEVAVPEGWHVERDRRYGGTFVRIVRPPRSAATSPRSDV